MAFRKPGKKKIGLKVLVVGRPGAGKTIFGLTFPKIAGLDSENGMTFYEETEAGKNLVMVDNTQSFYDMEDDMEDAADSDEIETFLIDSETKFYANIQDAIMNVEEKRAKSKGRDVLDSNLSVRSWGKIKQISERLQNLKIDLTSKGKNLVSIAQIKDKKEKVGNDFKVVGFDIVMQKGADYDYDIVIKMDTKLGEDGETIYYGEILKDRTRTYNRGDKVDNPSFDLWKDSVAGMSSRDEVKSTYGSDEDEKKYEEQVEEEEKTAEERIVDLIKSADTETKKAIQQDFKDKKVPAGMKNMTAKQKEALKEIVEKYSK